MPVDVFYVHRIALRILGVRFPNDIKKPWLGAIMDIYLVFNNICSIVWAVLFFYGAYFYTYDDFLNRVIGTTAGISVAGSVSKYIVFRTKNHKLLDLMKTLGHFEANSDRGRLVIKVSKFYTVSVIMIIVNANIHPFFEPFHRTMPYFTRNKSGEFTEVLIDYIFGIYSSIVVLMGNVTGDVVFLMMSSQICHKLYILGNTMNCIGTKWDPENKDIMDFGEPINDDIIIKMCVEEHNRLLAIKMKLEGLFSSIIMTQLAYSFADTCFTLFAISQDNDMIAATQKLTPQFVALFLEIFLYCWGGEMIHNHFEELHHASYESEWYNLNEKNRASLVILQSFTSRPVNITAFIFNFNFKFYETICREAFSYYTIMYQFFSQK